MRYVREKLKSQEYSDKSEKRRQYEYNDDFDARAKKKCKCGCVSSYMKVSKNKVTNALMPRALL